MSSLPHVLTVLALALSLFLAGAIPPDASTTLALPASEPDASVCGGTLEADADATVQQSSLDPLGSALTLRVMRESTALDQSEALIHFPELETIVPAGSAIQSAELVLHLATVGIVTPPFTLGSTGAGSSWVESTVTWDTRPKAAGKLTTRTYIPRLGTATTEVRLDATALVRLWVSGAIPERTIFLHPGATDMDIAFHSREARLGHPQLVVRCTPIQQPVPPDSLEMDKRQAQGLARLVAGAAFTPMISLDRGAVRLAGVSLAIPREAGATGVERARWFVTNYADALRLRDPEAQLQLGRRTHDGQHVFFRQLHEGIPVHGAEIGVHMLEGRFALVSGSYLPDITADPHPALTAEQAMRIVQELEPDGKITTAPQLRFLNTGLSGGPDKETHLTWLVSVRNSKAYFVDADSGKVRLERPAVISGFVLDLEDANGADYSTYCGDWDTTSVDDQVCSEDGCTAEGWADPETNAAWHNIRDVYTWYAYLPYGFARDSYDDDGSEIEIYIHVTDNGSDWNNAHYLTYGECFEFGEGYALSQDIVAHEFTHAVTEYTSDLDYENEPGALNESFSDVFGEMTEGDHPDWLMGTTLPGGPLRNLRHPITAGDDAQPSVYHDALWHPLSSDPDEDNDYGGVHTNSGVPNRAAYLLIDGNGPLAPDPDPVLGIGAIKGVTLLSWVQMLLSSSASMLDMRNLAVYSAQLFVSGGAYGFTANDVCAVRNAYANVGLGWGDADCDGQEDNLDLDADGDYTYNENDNCPTVPNTGQYDADGDGAGDACDPDADNDGDLNGLDNCPLVANANQADWDFDGKGDVCEDGDYDGLMDNLDNCPSHANHDQADLDGDGEGDACDVDDDGDGDPDTADNCPVTSNPDQAESDGDIYGDACDLCPGLNSNDNGDPDGDGKGNPCDDDDDNDGVLDGVDNCQYVANANQLDLDNDGEGIACDQDEYNFVYNLRYRVQYKPNQGPIELGLPDECTMCGAMGQIAAHYWNEARVTYGAPFYARIIDSNGLVVADSGSDFRTALTQVLRFQPAPYAFEAGMGGPARALSVADTKSSDVDYTLEIFPSPRVDPSVPHEFSVVFAEVLEGAVYLPVIVR